MKKKESYLSPIDKFVQEHFQVSAFNEMKDILNDTQLQEVKRQFESGNEQIKLKKTETVPYTIIKAQNRSMFAIRGELYAKGGFSDEVEKGLVVLRLCQNIDTGEFCLVKIAKKSKISKGESAFIEKTGALLGEVSRLNSEGDEKYYIFMKIIPGETLNKALKNYYFNIIDQTTIYINLLTKMQEMHEKGIIHRDLNSNNILIDPSTLEVNIIDFGQSLQADSDGVARVSNEGLYCEYASGIDLMGSSITLKKISTEPFLIDIANQLEQKAGRIGDWQIANLQPIIDDLKKYLSTLDPKIVKEDEKDFEYIYELRNMIEDTENPLNMKKARALFSKIKNINLPVNSKQETLIMLAVKHHREGMVQLLTEGGCDLTKNSTEGLAAINYALGYGASAEIKKMVNPVQPPHSRRKRGL